MFRSAAGLHGRGIDADALALDQPRLGDQHQNPVKGNVAAQLAYGSLHTRGWGVQRDLVEAYMWLGKRWSPT